MAKDTIELIETPETCDETTEYDNRIENEVDVEVEPDADELVDTGWHPNWEEAEQQFARFERNYRARRIRELTLAPIRKKKGRITRAASEAAA